MTGLPSSALPICDTASSSRQDEPSDAETDQGAPEPLKITNSFITGPAIQIGSVGGDVTIALNRRDYQVQWLRPTTTPSYLPQRHRTPSRLLDTRREVVPYLRRPAEERRLLDWLVSEPPASVLLLHGAGGRGKTRLANAFATHSHTSGWRVAHALNRLTDKHSMLPDAPAAATPSADVLVVVDYAERWPIDLMLTLITDLAREHSAVKLRVLLLARSIQDLWQPLCDHLDPTPIELPEPIPLLDLTATPEDRVSAFAAAAQAFHTALGLGDACTTAPPEDLAHDDYASPLILHMAALAAVCAERSDEEVARRDELSGYLLAHERRLWPPHPKAADTVFLATLFGPVAGEDNALSLFEIAGLTSSATAGRELLMWHDRVYPSVRGLPPLLPDRFGEDYVAEHLKAHPRAAELVRRVAQSGDVAPGVLRNPAAVLSAAAERHPHVREVIWELVPECPALYLTPNAELVRLATAHAPFLIRALLVDFLPHPSIGMRALGLELNRSLARDLTDDLPATTRVAVLMNLASRIAEIGDNPDMVWTLMHQCAAITLDPSQASPEFANTAAHVMMNLSVHFARADDWPNAVMLAEKAVQVARGAGGDNEADRDICLVAALNNLSSHLRQADRDDESDAAAAEALEVAEHATGASIHVPGLAGVMTKLAGRFAGDQNMDDAVRAMWVAARTYLGLARTSPDFYTVEASASMNKLAGYQLLAGQLDQASTSIGVAVTIVRNALERGMTTLDSVLPLLLYNAAIVEHRSSTAVRTARARVFATEAAERYRAVLPRYPGLRDQLTKVLAFLREIDPAETSTPNAT
ncbi:hypothetical protein SK854_01745 [Lentzea sp. BCCO 10_0061]|uniref:Tetratricopeptide repeat protein n=1 Tax=Lentzea sokolovensis TaxID=3095429 RepID=A0ABU4UMU6_9PSEU|nr:hypothetical protein [Lentzea sp. BCCO 10_0061]MDX8140816.1 hypothetical protein [Lentzea sp. BCCO 10_0061]